MDVSPVVEALSGCAVSMNVPMSKHTSFRVGGPADAMLLPASVGEVRRALAACREYGVPATVMGSGTNLVVRDGGIRGLVVKFDRNFAAYSFAGSTLIAQAGARLMALAASAVNEHRLAGFAFAGGIPGSVGGAIMMNAGAYDGEIRNIATRVRYIDPESLELNERICEMSDFRYRGSFFMDRGFVVVEAEFALSPDDGSEKAKLEDYLARRKKKQPLTLPSAGSIFKRPEGCFAGALIEQAGLKGMTVGGARVSELHAGFIVNANNATAKDITDLIALVQERVYAHAGILLSPEVRIIGEER